MDQPFEFFVQLCKCPKLGKVGDGAFHQLAFLKMLHLQNPWVGLQLANGQANALALLVNGDHLDLDFLSHFKHLAGMVNTLPADFRQVYQSIRAIDIDKRPKICQRGDPSGFHVALLQLIQQAVFDGLACFL